MREYTHSGVRWVGVLNCLLTSGPPVPLLLQWDLVCERKQLANVAQTVLMFGILVGNVVFGMLADR